MTVIHTGLSVEDATKLALSLAQPEFERLQDIATETACARAEELIVERLLPRLIELHPQGVETFADPDVQYALLAAQRTYARTGDKDVADVLVDILVDRTKETERSVLQLALNASLEVAAKLTADQFAALSLIWLIKYTINNSVNSRDALRKYIETTLGPHVPLLRKSTATYQHLEYAGCGTIAAGEAKIEDAMRRTYAGVFSKGFTEDELSRILSSANLSKDRVSSLLMPCLNDSTRQQINVINETRLDERGVELGMTDIEMIYVRALLNNHLMHESEARVFLLETCPPVMETLCEVWNDSPMKNMTLTTVGITIAHANCRRILGQSPADLSIWIN